MRGDFEGVAACGAAKLEDMMGEGEDNEECGRQANETNVKWKQRAPDFY